MLGLGTSPSMLGLGTRISKDFNINCVQPIWMEALDLKNMVDVLASETTWLVMMPMENPHLGNKVIATSKLMNAYL